MIESLTFGGSFDVDGVFTDGRFYLSDAGIESKAFHTQDGFGIRNLLDADILNLQTKDGLLDNDILALENADIAINNRIQNIELSTGLNNTVLSGSLAVYTVKSNVQVQAYIVNENYTLLNTAGTVFGEAINLVTPNGLRLSPDTFWNRRLSYLLPPNVRTSR